MGFSIINHPFWVAPFQETSICIHMYVCIYTYMYIYIYIGVIFIIIHDNYIENSMGGVIYWIKIYIYVYIHDNSHKPFTVIGVTSPSSPAPSRSSPPATAAHQGWHLRHRHRHLRAMDLYWGFGGIFSPISGGIYVEIDVFWDFGSWWKTKFRGSWWDFIWIGCIWGSRSPQNGSLRTNNEAFCDSIHPNALTEQTQGR